MQKGLIFLVFLVSCATRGDHSAEYIYRDDGTAKPKVAFIPVIDKSHADLSWNLSDELSEMVYNKLSSAGEFYLTDDFEKLGPALVKQNDLNPFFEEMEWIKESNTSTEFLVFIELVEHKLTPKTQSTGFFSFSMLQSYVLDIALRVRVLDIRGLTPKAILQEIIQESFHIPWRFTSIDYKKSGWSHTAFYLSPLGSAHSQIVRRITKQVGEYILIAKNN